MTDRELVSSYIPIAKFISSLCGSTCEVVLHDLTDIDHSLIYISGVDLTGRKVGDGLINFTIDDSFDLENRLEDFSVNVPAEQAAANGDMVRCSTYYIRNRKKRIVGFLGVNQDVTELLSIKEKVDSLLNLSPVADSDHILTPGKAISAKNMVNAYLDNAIRELGCSSADDLSKEDRRRVIELLAEKNMFIIKGCVNIVAKRLHISAPTLYRYLGEAKDD